MTFITAQGLRKTCQTKAEPMRALDGLNLPVEQGTVRGLLGPSGVRKTTFVKVLTTLLHPESGRASVAGIDVFADPAKVRPLINTSGQYAAVDEVLTARENLVLIGRLYRIGTHQTKRRAEELLEAFDLTEVVDRPLKGFSDGVQKHVDLTGALVVNPPVLFLDEPTTGLDPQARMGLWEVIREHVGEGITVLLATQYLEEASQLVNSIFVVDHGHVIAEGTANEPKMSVGGKRIELILVDEANINRAQRAVASSAGTEVAVTGRVFTAQVGDPTVALIAVLRILGEEGAELHDADIRRPTPDDVFLTLTGHAAEEQEVVA